MTPPGLSAIVLAGGRSSRFGRDKLEEPVGGRTLLDRAVDAVRPIASEILVVAAPGRALILPDDVRLIHDTAAYEGPLVGLLGGLRSAIEPRIVVVGGDMPGLVGSVLLALAAALDAEPPVDAVMLEVGGDAPPLPLALRREPAVVRVSSAVETGERRLRTIAGLLDTRIIPEAAWRTLDPDGATLRDIDTERTSGGADRPERTADTRTPRRRCGALACGREDGPG